MPGNAALTALQSKYLKPQAPIYSETTEIKLFIDGVAYFDALSTLIQQVESSPAGSCIYIAGWWFDAGFDLRGPGAPAPARPLKQRLAVCADGGADVRIVLNGGLHLYTAEAAAVVGWVMGTPFRDNFLAMQDLRGFKLSNGHQPLANSVLFDWSGAWVTGSQHQKATVIRVGSSPPVAFVGGIDYQPSRRDKAPHSSFTYPKGGGGPWGWHDAGIRLKGAAVEGVWNNFRSRWNEARTLPKKHYTDYAATPTKVRTSDGYMYSWPRKVFNPPTTPVDEAPPAVPAPSPNRSVQVMQSRYPRKVPGVISKGDHWDHYDTHYSDGGIRQIYDTFVRAIGAAEKYVYIEDQFLGDSATAFGGEGKADDYSLIEHLKQTVALVSSTKNVKLILVGSGLSDPGDMSPGERNQTFGDVGGGDIKDDLYDELPSTRKGNVVVWRILHTTVHSKILMIDDKFLAVGSANIHSRSMYGVDGELSVAVVDSGQGIANCIENFRVKLWAEHLRQPTGSSPSAFSGDPGWALAAGVESALRNLSTGIGAWKPSWLPTSASGMWSQAGNPSGFVVPSSPGRAFVGPP